MAPKSCAGTSQESVSRLPRGDAVLGKLTVIGHPLAAGLRRALGVALIVGTADLSCRLLSCRATAAASEPRRPE